MELITINTSTKQTSYQTVTEIFDWGASITKVIVSLGAPVKQGSVYTDTFKVIDYKYTITQVKDLYSDSNKISGLVADKCTGETRGLIDNFSVGEFSYEDINLTYASYMPEKDQSKNPLIIWLHGWGEGGTDARLQIHENKSANFSSKEIQAYFGGAYVLLPQAKTDKTLNHKLFTTPTYERLIKAGAKNVYYSLFDDVHDISGLYKEPDGTPFEYNGHFSWIYVFNNECKETINGKTITIMEWLSSISLDKR